jgi:hypothetical protein
MATVAEIALRSGLYKFLDRQTYLFGYLPQQQRRNIPIGMKRNCGAAAISMPILLV